MTTLLTMAAICTGGGFVSHNAGLWEMQAVGYGPLLKGLGLDLCHHFSEVHRATGRS